MRRDTARRRLAKILEKLDECIVDLEELKDDAQETHDNIEPYGDSYELTEEQEERKEWFYGLADAIDDLLGYIDLSTLNDIAEE